MKTSRHLRIRFASWLDAFVAGTSTPVNRNASDSAFADLQRATAQVHELNRHVSEVPPEPSLVPTWETFMSSSPSIPITSSTPFASRPIATDNPRASTRWLRLDRASSLLIAAAMLLVLTAGIWQASGGPTPGNDSPPPTDSNLAMLQATPGSGEPVDLPTAEDCTVKPLTVDEVLAYIQYPYVDFNGSESTYQELLPGLASLPSTPDPSAPTISTPEQLFQVTEIQHMWMSCVLAKSLFQKWALESPVFVQKQILSVLPPLTGVDDTRELLLKLEEKGPDALNAEDDIFLSFGLWSTEKSYARLIVDPDIGNTYATSTYIITGYISFDDDGNPERTTNIFANVNEDIETAEPADRVVDACSNFHFIWSELRQTWLVERIPECG